jgi:hypothetical protein
LRYLRGFCDSFLWDYLLFLDDWNTSFYLVFFLFMVVNFFFFMG